VHLTRRDLRQPERSTQRLDIADLDPGTLRDLRERVSLPPVARQRRLERQQRQPLALDRVAQLTDRGPIIREPLHELAPSLALGVRAGTVEQTVALWVEAVPGPRPEDRLA
jgi:hypothetical protein